MGELEDRYRAARGYAGLSQTDFASRLGMSKSTVIRIEQGIDAPEFQRRTNIAAYSTICGLPEQWFTADWSQLASGRQPPDDELAQLRDAVTVQTTGLREEIDERLTEIKEQAVDRAQFEEAVHLLRQGIEALSERLRREVST